MNLKINHINQTASVSSHKVALFKTNNNYPKISKYSGHNIMKNSDLCLWNKLVFSVIDNFFVILGNYPTIISKFINMSEKIVSKTGSLSPLNIIL